MRSVLFSDVWYCKALRVSFCSECRNDLEGAPLQLVGRLVVSGGLASGGAVADKLPREISPRWGQRNNLLSFACDFLLIGLPKAAVSSVLWRWVSLGRKLGPALLWQISLLPDGRSTRVVGYGRSFSASLMGDVILNPLQSTAFGPLPPSQNRPSNWVHGLESSLGNWGGAGAGRAPWSAPMLTQPTRAARLHKAAGDPRRNGLRWKISGVSF